MTALAASKVGASRETEPMPFTPCLNIEDLRVHFPIKHGFLRRGKGLVKAVDGITLSIGEGETVAIVGESGCGKSTLGRAVLGVFRPTAGAVNYRRRGSSAWIDLAQATPKQWQSYRADLRMIFQDPFTALNPRIPIIDAIGQPLRANGLAEGRELQDRVAEIMQKVGLRPEYMSRYPHAFSGGERQRIVIARALVVRPHVVVADEAVSALDVSVRAQTLNLLQDLQQEFNLTYLFVSHDLAVVKHISNRVAVMYTGRVVEVAPTNDVFALPMHPYTEALLSAIPVPDPKRRGRRSRVRLTGEVADPSNQPTGCHFHPRCGYATELCRTQVPALRAVAPHRQAACHYAETLSLKGVL
ncbi:MAG: oligopeptide/dipeptide ABC transporter ATP-binding protein [Microvirga sp.]